MAKSKNKIKNKIKKKKQIGVQNQDSIVRSSFFCSRNTIHRHYILSYHQSHNMARSGFRCSSSDSYQHCISTTRGGWALSFKTDGEETFSAFTNGDGGASKGWVEPLCVLYIDFKDFSWAIVVDDKHHKSISLRWNCVFFFGVRHSDQHVARFRDSVRIPLKFVASLCLSFQHKSERDRWGSERGRKMCTACSNRLNRSRSKRLSIHAQKGNGKRRSIEFFCFRDYQNNIRSLT